jgi:GH35 family endo-1,4-beta-xylanase
MNTPGRTAATSRRVFLQTTLLAAGAPAVLRGADTAGGPSEDDRLAEAREQIARHRRAQGVLVVRGAEGRPVPGARVKVEQTRHEFRFGCNFFMFDRLQEPELEAAYRRRFADLLNFATLGFYWNSYERERGQPAYAYTDKVLEWTRTAGIECKGHPLVWDHPAGSPRWLPEADAELARLSNGRVEEIVGRFKGRLDCWDVVNEATHLPDRANQTRMARWGEQLGSDPYTRRPLLLARAANPTATLLVNDYRLVPRYYQLLDGLREGGTLLFDAVGIQSHMHDGGWPLRRVREVCDTYARLGLPLHFTETTLVSGPRLGPGENWGPTTPELEARQAEAVARFYTMLFAQPAVQAITWWDFSDRGAWQRAAAGLVRADMTPKPAYERLLSLVKGEWWTRTEGTTDAQGQFALDAFGGRYAVTAEGPDGRPAALEMVWRTGAENRVELRL